MKIEFSQEELYKVAEIISRYPEGKSKSALLPILHLAQDKFGWCSVEVMDYVASLLKIKPVEVYEVASFYTMFNLKPTGKYVLEVCRTGPCCLRGAEKIIDYLEHKLEVKVGQTTKDGMFTLKTVECLAACGMAPMLQLDDKYIEFLSESKVDELLADCRANQHQRNPVLWETVFSNVTNS